MRRSGQLSNRKPRGVAYGERKRAEVQARRTGASRRGRYRSKRSGRQRLRDRTNHRVLGFFLLLFFSHQLRLVLLFFCLFLRHLLRFYKQFPFSSSSFSPSFFFLFFGGDFCPSWPSVVCVRFFGFGGASASKDEGPAIAFIWTGTAARPGWVGTTFVGPSTLPCVAAGSVAGIPGAAAGAVGTLAAWFWPGCTAGAIYELS